MFALCSVARQAEVGTETQTAASSGCVSYLTHPFLSPPICKTGPMEHTFGVPVRI